MNLFSVVAAFLLPAQLVTPALVVFQHGILGDVLDAVFRHEPEHRVLELKDRKSVV